MLKDKGAFSVIFQTRDSKVDRQHFARRHVDARNQRLPNCNCRYLLIPGGLMCFVLEPAWAVCSICLLHPPPRPCRLAVRAEEFVRRRTLANERMTPYLLRRSQGG